MKVGQSIQIGDSFVYVQEIQGDRVRLSIKAPKKVRISKPTA